MLLAAPCGGDKALAGRHLTTTMGRVREIQAMLAIFPFGSSIKSKCGYTII